MSAAAAQAADKLAAVEQAARQEAEAFEQHLVKLTAEHAAAAEASEAAQAQLAQAQQAAEVQQGRLAAAQQQCSTEQHTVKQLQEALAQQARTAEADRATASSEAAAARAQLQGAQQEREAQILRLEKALADSEDKASAAQRASDTELQQSKAALAAKQAAVNDLADKVQAGKKEQQGLLTSAKFSQDSNTKLQKQLQEMEKVLHTTAATLQERGARPHTVMRLTSAAQAHQLRLCRAPAGPDWHCSQRQSPSCSPAAQQQPGAWTQQASQQVACQACVACQAAPQPCARLAG